MSKTTPHCLVLLPGMMCDERLFSPLSTAIHHDIEHQIDIHVPVLNGADTMAELASQILADLPPSFALAGLSMGGILAMEMMAQAPQRVERLALLDTNPLAETPEGVLRRNRQIEDAAMGMLKTIMADEMKPHYLADTPNREQILKLCMDMALSLGTSCFISQSRALRDRADQRETLRAVSCPTLILHGAEDMLCPPERHILMHELIPHAVRHQIAGAGHLPPLETPAETTAQLMKWLTG